jgi:hypothetical protein
MAVWLPSAIQLWERRMLSEFRVDEESWTRLAAVLCFPPHGPPAVRRWLSEPDRFRHSLAETDVAVFAFVEAAVTAFGLALYIASGWTVSPLSLQELRRFGLVRELSNRPLLERVTEWLRELDGDLFRPTVTTYLRMARGTVHLGDVDVDRVYAACWPAPATNRARQDMKLRSWAWGRDAFQYVRGFEK